MPILSSAAVRAGIAFLLSFGLGKGASFVAALAIPRLVDARIYGVIELALTIGTLGAAALGFGATSVAMRSYLVDKDPRAPSIILGHCLWLAVIGLTAAGGLAVLGYGAQYVCGAALIVLFGLQFSAATYTRIQGRINLSGWFDNISMIVVLLLVGLFVLTGGTDARYLAWILLAAAAVIAVGAALLFFRMPPANLKELASYVLTVGTPMVLFSSSMMLVFGTIRIAIAKGLSLADVASFSLCSRICLVLIFTSQAFVTGLFRSVYQADNSAIGRTFALWTAVLSAMALILAVASYLGASLLVAGTDIPAGDFAAIVPAVVTQTTLWVLNSNLEIFVVRELLSRRASIACVAIAASGLVAGLAVAWFGLLSLMMVINIYSIAMAILLLIQMRLLSRQGIVFRSTYFALPLVAAPWLVLLLPEHG